jgi:predicted RNase H-like HicB family nuclease
MTNHQNHFEFESAIIKDGRWFVALCLDLDVASQGKSVAEAKKMLAEAVELYLEGCFEDNTPYLRPAPREEDPLQSSVKPYRDLPAESRFQGSRGCLMSPSPRPDDSSLTSAMKLP